MADEDQSSPASNPNNPSDTSKPHEPGPEASSSPPTDGSDGGAADAEKALEAAQDAVSKLAEQAADSGSSDAGSPGSGEAQETAPDAVAAENTSSGAEPDAEAAAPPKADGSNAASAEKTFNMPDLKVGEGPESTIGIELIGDVNLNVKIELGRTRMLVDDVLRLSEGAVVELEKLAGDPVDIYVNDRPVARGEVLVLNDNFCVRVNEILENSAETIERLGA